MGRRSTISRHFGGSPFGTFLGTKKARQTCVRVSAGAGSKAPEASRREISDSRKADSALLAHASFPWKDTPLS